MGYCTLELGFIDIDQIERYENDLFDIMNSSGYLEQVIGH